MVPMTPRRPARRGVEGTPRAHYTYGMKAFGIVDRYIIRESFPPFVVGILVFTFVMLMSQFLRLVEMIINKGVGLGVAFRLVGYLMPSIMVITIPMSVLLASLVVFGRLSADNEITALRSGGLSVQRLAVPVFLFSTAVSALTFYLITTALPRGNQAFRSLMFEVVRSKAALGFKERVFNDDFDGLIIYVNKVPAGENPVMRGVIIHDYRGEAETPRRESATIFADEGRLISDPEGRNVTFRLRNGSIHSLGRDRTRYQQINFEIHDLHLTMLQGITGQTTLPKGLREMTIPELRRKMEDYGRQGLPSNAPRVEIHKKFAIPFAGLIFGILGLSLGIIFRKGEKMVAFAVCVGVVIVYYVLMVAGEPMGKQGLVPPWLSMWFANILFTAAGLILFLTVCLERMPGAVLAGRLAARRGGGAAP